MKDSQRARNLTQGADKYIKANNERFSTAGESVVFVV